LALTTAGETSENCIKKMATNSTNGANLGFENELWKMADGLRSNMDAAEYKHVVLGLIFLKYISDAFEEQHARLDADRKGGADPEDPDEYRAMNIFWVPPEARWSNLRNRAKDPKIGKIVDDAMLAIERDNASLKGVLPSEAQADAKDRISGRCRLLQVGHARRHPGTWPHPHARALRRRGRGRGRWRAVRGQDGPPDRRTPRPDRAIRQARQAHLGQSEGYRLWEMTSNTNS